ncbi:MAG: glycerophosphodiester phosphodiesterase [Clostridia bacterium]|nr:glycerophosphodiester phosphodiesterase [Clostridia bacterium]
MEWYFILAIAVFATLLALFALWLFLIAPRACKKAMRPFLRPYAHRGLWGGEVPENSLQAFDRAAAQGFAIELDVQLSCDGTVMVFHDYTLDRVCGREGKLCALSAAELVQIPLSGTTQTIPTLKQVLQTVDGRVPLLIELKGESGDASLVSPLLEALADYKGAWCVESFNPLLLRAVKKQAPQVVRGLLSTDLIKEKRKGSKLLNFALTKLLVTFLCRPAFHAWDGHYPHRAALRVGIKLFGAASVVYTVRDENAYKRYLQRGIYPIFEGFVPKGEQDQ